MRLMHFRVARFVRLNPCLLVGLVQRSRATRKAFLTLAGVSFAFQFRATFSPG